MNLVIVDDHDIFRQSLAFLLSHTGQYNVIGSYRAAEELMAHDHSIPDCVMLDYHMPEKTGWQALDSVKEKWPNIPIVFLTGTHSVAVIRQILASGVAGVLHKRDSAEVILELLSKLGGPEPVISPEISAQLNSIEVTFTEREFEILGCLLRGLTADQIASELAISRRTVEKHKENMMRKAEVHHLAQLLELGRRLEL